MLKLIGITSGLDIYNVSVRNGVQVTLSVADCKNGNTSKLTILRIKVKDSEIFLKFDGIQFSVVHMPFILCPFHSVRTHWSGGKD